MADNNPFAQAIGVDTATEENPFASAVKESIPTTVMDQKEAEKNLKPDAFKKDENISKIATDQILNDTKGVFDSPKSREIYYRELEKKGYDYGIVKAAGDQASQYTKLFQQSKERANKGDADAIETTAEILANTGKYEDALPLYSKLVSDNPNSKSANYGMGFVLDRLGKKDEAQEYLDKAQQSLPTRDLPQSQSLQKSEEARLKPYQERMNTIANAIEKLTVPMIGGISSMESGLKTLQDVDYSKLSPMSNTYANVSNMVKLVKGVGEFFIGTALSNPASPSGIAFDAAIKAGDMANLPADKLLSPVSSSYKFLSDHKEAIANSPIGTAFNSVGLKPFTDAIKSLKKYDELDDMTKNSLSILDFVAFGKAMQIAEHPLTEHGEVKLSPTQIRDAAASITPNDIPSILNHPDNPEAAKLQKDILDLHDSKTQEPDHAQIFQDAIDAKTKELEKTLADKSQADHLEAHQKAVDTHREDLQKLADNPMLPEAARNAAKEAIDKLSKDVVPPTHPETLTAIKDLAQRISKGEKITDENDLRLQKNYPEELKKEVDNLKAEVPKEEKETKPINGGLQPIPEEMGGDNLISGGIVEGNGTPSEKGIIYHGTPKIFSKLKSFEDLENPETQEMNGVHFNSTKEGAQRFGKNIITKSLDGLKIYDASDKSIIELVVDWLIKNKKKSPEEALDMARNEKTFKAVHDLVLDRIEMQGYDGIKLANEYKDGSNDYWITRDGLEKMKDISLQETPKETPQEKIIPSSDLDVNRKVVDEDKEVVDDLKKAMENGEKIAPIVLNEKGEVMDGNKRLMAAKELGKDINTVTVDGVSKEQAQAITKEWEEKNLKPKENEINSNRLSQEEKQGAVAGGKINVAATNIAESFFGTGGDGEGIGKELSQDEIREKQSEALEKYAKENGVWVESPFVTFGDTPHTRGAEAIIYFNKDGKTITKINSGSVHGDWREFFERIAVHNHLFPDTKYTLKGFTKLSGDVSAILEQDRVISKRGATKAEIAEDMAKSGFKPTESLDGKEAGTDYFNAETGVYVRDLHGQNVLMTEGGNLRYIDPIIELDTKDKGYGGVRDKILAGDSRKESLTSEQLTAEREKAVKEGYSSLTEKINSYNKHLGLEGDAKKKNIQDFTPEEVKQARKNKLAADFEEAISGKKKIAEEAKLAEQERKKKEDELKAQQEKENTKENLLSLQEKYNSMNRRERKSPEGLATLSSINRVSEALGIEKHITSGGKIKLVEKKVVEKEIRKPKGKPNPESIKLRKEMAAERKAVLKKEPSSIREWIYQYILKGGKINLENYKVHYSTDIPKEMGFVLNKNGASFHNLWETALEQLHIGGRWREDNYWFDEEVADAINELSKPSDAYDKLKNDIGKYDDHNKAMIDEARAYGINLDEIENEIPVADEFVGGLSEDEFNEMVKNIPDPSVDDIEKIDNFVQRYGIEDTSDNESGGTLGEAEAAYGKALADIEKRIDEAKRERQRKLDELNKKIDLFGGEGEKGKIFDEAQDQSPEQIKKVLQPFDDKIAKLEREKQDFIDNRENFLRKDDNQLRIEEPKEEYKGESQNIQGESDVSSDGGRAGEVPSGDTFYNLRSGTGKGISVEVWRNGKNVAHELSLHKFDTVKAAHEYAKRKGFIHDADPKEASLKAQAERKAIADRLRKLKADKNSPKVLFDFGLGQTLYNGAIEFAARQVEKGTKLGKAIENTIRWVDEQLKGKKWDKKTFANHLADRHKVTINGEEKTIEKDNTRQTAQLINGFYSPLEQGILDSKLEKATGKEWKKKLSGTTEGDEMKFTGTNDFLDANADKVLTKKDIHDYWENNRIEISEVMKDSYSTNTSLFNDLLEKRNEATESVKDIFENNRELATSKNAVASIPQTWDGLIGEFAKQNKIIEGRRLATAQRAIKVLDTDIKKEEPRDETKFSQYQLEGDKEKNSYKEVLITMPRKGWQSTYEVKKFKDGYNVFDTHENEFVFKAATTESHAKEYADKFNSRKDKEEIKFKSTHFDEPNILAHLRMNVRTDAEGKKTLFIEEIQSDWNAKGRKEGFIGKVELPKGWKVEEKENKMFPEKRYFVYDEKGEQVNPPSSSKEKALYEALYERKIAKHGTGLVPQAPFVENTADYTKLAIKTALQHAVKEGAERIAWTTGEQQNERYDLSKQVNKIEVEAPEEAKGVHFVDIHLANHGDTENLEVENGVVRSGAYKGKKLEDIIGKEYAEKVLSVPQGESKTLEGEDLKIGGRGMIGFYGSPKEGKLGIVGQVVESMFGKGSVKTTDLTIEDKFKNIRVEELPNGKWVVYNKKQGLAENNPRFDTEKEAHTYLDEMTNGEFKNAISTQHSIDITPEIKASVEKGIPLFKGLTADDYINRGKEKLQKLVKGTGKAYDIQSLAGEILEALTDMAIGYTMKGANGLKEFIKHAREILGDKIKGVTDKELKEHIFDKARGGDLDFAKNFYEAHKDTHTAEEIKGVLEDQGYTKEEIVKIVGEKEWTGIAKKNRTDAEGVLELFDAPERSGWEKAVAEGMRELGDDAYNESQKKMLAWDGQENFNPTDAEIAQMLYHRTKTMQELKSLEPDMASADENIRKAAMAKYELYNANLKLNTRVLSETGTTAARAFNIRQAMGKLDVENGLAVKRMEVMASKKGKLTPEEENELKQIQATEDERIAKIKQELEKEKEAEIKRRVAEEIKKLATEGVVKKQRIRDAANKAADKILKLRIPKEYASLRIDAGAWDLLVKGVAETVRAGGDIAQKIVDMVEKGIVKLSKDDISKLTDYFKNADKNSALQEIKDLAEEEQSKTITKSAIAKGFVNEIVRNNIQNGLKGDDVIDQTHKDLQSIFPDITRNQVEDAFLKTGDFKLPDKKKVENVIKNEETNLKKLLDLKKKLSTLQDENKAWEKKTGNTKKTVSDQIENIQNQIDKELAKRNIKIDKGNKADREVKQKMAEEHNARVDAIIKKIGDNPELQKLKELLEKSKIDVSTAEDIFNIADKTRTFVELSNKELKGLPEFEEIRKDISKMQLNFERGIDDAERDIKLNKFKRASESKIKQNQKIIDSGAVQEPNTIRPDFMDAAAVQLDIAKKKSAQQVSQIASRMRNKRMGGVAKTVDLIMNGYVAQLIGNLKTAAVVGVSSVVKQPLETITRATTGEATSLINPSLKKAAGAEGGISVKAERERYKAHYGAFSETQLKRMVAKTQDALNHADIEYEKAKASGDEKKISRAKSKLTGAVINHLSNTIYQWIGTNSYKDAADVFLHGTSKLEELLGEGIKENFKDLSLNEQTKYVMNMMGATHAVMKNFSARAQFAAEFMYRLENKAKRGVDIRDAGEIIKTVSESYISFARGKFQQDNLVVDKFNAAMRAVRDNKSDTKMGEFVGSLAGAVLKFKQPVLRTSTNIASEAILDYTLGGIVAPVLHINELRKAIKSTWNEGDARGVKDFVKNVQQKISEIPPERADAILRAYRKGGFAALGYTLAAFGYIQFGGFWSNKGNDKEKGRIKMFGKDLSPLLAKIYIHTPFLMPSLMVANYQHILSKKGYIKEDGVERPKTPFEKNKDAALSDVNAMIETIPFVHEQTHYANPLKTTTVPLVGNLMRDIGAMYDVDEDGNVIKRDVRSFSDWAKVNFGIDRKSVGTKPISEKQIEEHFKTPEEKQAEAISKEAEAKGKEMEAVVEKALEPQVQELRRKVLANKLTQEQYYDEMSKLYDQLDKAQKVLDRYKTPIKRQMNGK